MTKYYTLAVKKAVYKWRKDNEQWKQYALDYAKNNYNQKQQEFRDYAKMNYERKKFYSYERIARIFRNILL